MKRLFVLAALLWWPFSARALNINCPGSVALNEGYDVSAASWGRDVELTLYKNGSYAASTFGSEDRNEEGSSPLQVGFSTTEYGGPGPVSFYATASGQNYDDDGYFSDSSSAVTYIGSPPEGLLESWNDITSTSTTYQLRPGEVIVLKGWAADPDDGSAVSSVNIYLDGGLVTTAQRRGLSRPDVATATGHSTWNTSGWMAYYALPSAITTGSHTIQTYAVDSMSQPTLIGSLSLTIATAASPDGGQLETINGAASGTTPGAIRRGDFVRLIGWAQPLVGVAWNDAVRIYLDGQYLGSSPLGIARPDITASHPAWMPPGWSFSYAMPASLAVGWHCIQARALDSNGVEWPLLNARNFELLAASSSAPGAPSGLSASTVALTSFLLNWTAVTATPAVDCYEVRLNVDSADTNRSVSLGWPAPNTGTSFYVNGLYPGNTVRVYVRARNTSGNWSAWSSSLTVTPAVGTQPDSDTDGIPNRVEALLGTNPATAAEAPASLGLKTYRPN